MIGLRLVCAWDAVDLTRTIARILSAEDFNVTIATGQTGLDDLDDPKRPPEHLIIVWSTDGAYSPFVTRWVEENDAASLIEIETVTGVAPEIEGRLQSPIDFSAWRGVRGGSEWEELNRRVSLAVYGPPPAPSRRAQAAMLFGALAVAAVGAAGVMRAFDAGTQEARATPPPAPVQLVEDRSAMGGPVSAPVELDEGPFRPAPFLRMAPLADLPEPAALTELDSGERDAVENRSFLQGVAHRLRGES